MGRNNLTHLLAAGTVGSGRPGSRFAASTSDPLTNRVRPKAIFTVGLGVMLRVRHGHLIQVVPEAIALSTVLKPTVKLCQRDALEGANDVVGAFGSEETFVIAGTEVPVRTFVILVAIESPDAADHDQTTDPVVPEIADIMKTEIGSCVSAFESDVIVKDELGQPNNLLGDGPTFLAGGARMISKRAEFPFHVDDTAVIRRQFGFRYLFHKWRRFDVDLELIAVAVSSSLVGR